MDRGAWWATVRGVTKSDFTFTLLETQFNPKLLQFDEWSVQTRQMIAIIGHLRSILFNKNMRDTVLIKRDELLQVSQTQKDTKSKP